MATDSEQAVVKEASVFHAPHSPEVGKLIPTPCGSMSYNVIRSIMEMSNTIRLGIGAEVGVYKGETSQYLLSVFPSLQLLCVDPYVDYSEYEEDRTSECMSEAEAIARQRLEHFGKRAKFIKDYSVSAAKSVGDNCLDFVFIDAIHTYEAVKEDIEAWYPKVRSGGLVMGHDVSWSGVKEAVEEFLVKEGKAGFLTPSTADVWLFVK